MSPLLPCVTVNPTQSHQATVIWLHGLGADGHDFEPIVPELRLDPALGIKFIFPHAPVMPVTINGGYPMRAWYDIRNADLSQREDEQGVRQSAEQIQCLIDHEIQQGIAANKIILAGFSQGGAITLHLATRLDYRLAGIIALSTYLTIPDKLAAEKTSENLNTPLLMAHGIQDPVVPIQRGQYSAKVLQDNGFNLSWFEYPMQHAVCPAEIQQIAHFIQQAVS